MQILVAGASGATGRLLVQQLLDRGHQVKALVRAPEKMAPVFGEQEGLTLIRANLAEMQVQELDRLTAGCDAVASCLGHNLTFSGIWGPPHRLVRNATRNLCAAIQANRPDKPVKFVLMNTAGNRNRDLNEPVGFAHRFVIALLRLLLPPHPDNEQAAEYLRVKVGQKDPYVEWVALRPDTLTDAQASGEYELHESPVRSPLFNPGKSSRINVAHCMAKLITEESAWERWKGKMPVLYNKGEGLSPKA